MLIVLVVVSFYEVDSARKQPKIECGCKCPACATHSSFSKDNLRSSTNNPNSLQLRHSYPLSIISKKAAKPQIPCNCTRDARRYWSPDQFYVPEAPTLEMQAIQDMDMRATVIRKEAGVIKNRAQGISLLLHGEMPLEIARGNVTERVETLEDSIDRIMRYWPRKNKRVVGAEEVYPEEARMMLAVDAIRDAVTSQKAVLEGKNYTGFSGKNSTKRELQNAAAMISERAQELERNAYSMGHWAHLYDTRLQLERDYRNRCRRSNSISELFALTSSDIISVSAVTILPVAKALIGLWAGSRVTYSCSFGDGSLIPCNGPLLAT
eukprot:gnl/MRDRNA2_/MRDRNA2_129239_c0_seq1.p1 gnl/MRDRNA2_/MRDRNA2_129239_c0~~gnl/MRDRNA2_/MRDRNA2_129239_c0_seq1.p1  ORF type:complete len:322 (-),score=30.44 gnl/MRDRNA2_/MRDRNA2_129239_c0_seq1:333-1298(-)